MRTFLSRLISSLFVMVLAASLAAQQMVCLSVHMGPALGVEANGAPSRLIAVLGGVTTQIFPLPGQTAPACSAAHEAAFVAAGYTTVRVNPNEFCITAGPGGAPIVAGAAYGTTDMALGLDNAVRPLPQPVPFPFFHPGYKYNGAGVPMPRINQAPLLFSVTIIVYVKIRVFGVPVTICVPITLGAGLPPQALQQDMVQQFEQLGFHGNLITIQNPLDPFQPLDMLQLERTAAGEPIEGVEIQWDPNSQLLVPHVTCCGLTPEFGAWEYGVATQGAAFQEPWSLCFGQPQVGGVFDIVHEMQVPNAIGINAISLAPTVAPVFNGILLVDPLQMVLEVGLTDPLGGIQRSWPIPPDPALAGFELMTQGVVLDPFGQHSFSTGMGIRIHP